ncbi:MAG: iron ABC transporter substrate-binding protein [Erythrobacter sp.]|nr:iron ABC transporter substrate-binding protein [Erythrobacter sp.]
MTLLSACAPAPSGAPAETTSPTFVSLNPCLDAILVEIAEPDQILAISHYSHQPGGSRMERGVALSFASTGGTAEEIIALEPDIVLASVFLPPSTKSALERAGLRIEAFGSPTTLDESDAQIERMAALVGSGEPGTAVRGPEIDTASGPTPSVLLWQAGQIVAGQETLIAQLIKEAGFTSHSEALGLGQADYVTLEQVLADPPDLLLVAGDSAGQQHPSLAKLEDTRVHFFDPSLFYCGGPSVVDARAELAALRASFEEGTE